MPKLQAHVCKTCNAAFDYLSMGADDPVHCVCGSTETDIVLGGRTLTTIIPAYPGCKRMKAGNVHTHGDRPKEKISVSVPTKVGGST